MTENLLQISMWYGVNTVISFLNARKEWFHLLDIELVSFLIRYLYETAFWVASRDSISLPHRVEWGHCFPSGSRESATDYLDLLSHSICLEVMCHYTYEESIPYYFKHFKSLTVTIKTGLPVKTRCSSQLLLHKYETRCH